MPLGCNLLGLSNSSTRILNSESFYGKHLLVSVTVANTVGTVTRFTSSVGPVLRMPEFEAAPQIIGERTTGETLSVSVPQVFSFPTAIVTHQWLRCSSQISVSSSMPPSHCSSIESANSTQYTLTAMDEGFYITVNTTATNSAGETKIVTTVAQLSYGRVEFRESGSWTAPAGVYRIDVLIVGGGGGGGNGTTCNDGSWCAGGGGGGGGAVISLNLSVVPGSIYSVVVGGPEQRSSFEQFVAEPGQRGQNFQRVQWGNHGGIGGAGYSNSNTPIQGFPNNSACGSRYRCGGAGAGSATISDITGTSLPYGGGGGGGPVSQESGANGIGVFGAGGGGGSGGNSLLTQGEPGKPGVVYIRWITVSNQ